MSDLLVEVKKAGLMGLKCFWRLMVLVPNSLMHNGCGHTRWAKTADVIA